MQAAFRGIPSLGAKRFGSCTRTYVRLRPDGEHPYLFVSERCAQRGEPYTADSFRQAHERAVKRAGLDYGKGKGTSPHGHRHAYGTRLTKAKVERRHIARAMHHRNLFSPGRLQPTVASRGRRSHTRRFRWNGCSQLRRPSAYCQALFHQDEVPMNAVMKTARTRRGIGPIPGKIQRTHGRWAMPPRGLGVALWRSGRRPGTR